jgi:capsid portal protein
MQGYKTLDEALELIAGAREFQTKKWPSTDLPDAGGRPMEEWYMLLVRYTRKFDEVYAETPSYIGDGTEPNIEGRKRIEKYAAIIANIAVWMTQAATADKKHGGPHD